MEVEVAVPTTAAYGDDGEVARAKAACGGTVKKRLPDAEVQSILSRERRECTPDILVTCRRKKSRSFTGASRRPMS